MRIVTASRIENIHIAPQGIVPLISPLQLKRGQLAITKQAKKTVIAGRQQVIDILNGGDSRLIATVGPCSIHDPRAAIEYAQRLLQLSKELADRLLILMRLYFEKPRTTTGWTGLIAEPKPGLGNGFDMEKGLKIARGLLLKINKIGLPVATEFLGSIIPQYIADLVTWGAIGARTTESQTHRQMASGLSMPVGFKNGTDGNIQIAVNAIVAARTPHAFLGISGFGQTSIVHTTGNPWVHLILRGGKRPNYGPASIKKAIEMLDEANQKSGQEIYGTKILVDCSHGNSGKDPERQAHVCRQIARQVVSGNQRIAGFMLESNLFSGNQPVSADLRYGVSITDACIGWQETEKLLRQVHKMLF